MILIKYYIDIFHVNVNGIIGFLLCRGLVDSSGNNGIPTGTGT